jgi:hypothetical protein
VVLDHIYIRPSFHNPLGVWKLWSTLFSFWMDCYLTLYQKCLQVAFTGVWRATTQERMVFVSGYISQKDWSHIYSYLFIYIPKIHKWLQPLDIKHVINQSMKGPCKHRTRLKRKHIYIYTHTHTHVRTRLKGTVTCIKNVGNLT